jgi:uncharacterized protein YdeI (YjbR/CyaY-like superfamily)
LNTLRVQSRDAWRAWLAEHHTSESELWLLFYKEHTGEKNVPYGALVEEALCFGWIDSLIKRLDDDRYLRKFTPRRPGSPWSKANKARVEKMIAQGRMTKVGQALVDEAKASGQWDRQPIRPTVSADDVPEELEQALAVHPEAAKTFEALAPTYRKQYILWIATAKRPETRQRRVTEAIELLERGERLGLR